MNDIFTLACLALRQHKLDQAVGVNGFSQKTLTLVYAYNFAKQAAKADFSLAIIYRGFLDEAQERTKAILAEFDAKEKAGTLTREEALSYKKEADLLREKSKAIHASLQSLSQYYGVDDG